MSSRYRQWLGGAIKRAELQQKADDMARERAQLADNPLCADVQTASLSHGQRSRMGQMQLNKSLSALVQHPAWQQGLLVQDYNTALAPRHVLAEQEATVVKCRKEAEGLFQYDTQIIDNPRELPVMFRACRETHGGLCCKVQGCAEAKTG